MMPSPGRRLAVFPFCGAGLLWLLLLAAPISAQDLDPHAFARVPVNVTFLVTGVSVSHGGVVTDATLPLTGVDAAVETPSLGIGHSFGLFGKTAQAFAALPYSWAQASGNVLGDGTGVSRAGFSDMRVRVSVLMRGAPAASLLEMAKAPRRTILGGSVTVGAPTGQFFLDKMINLGTNRWAVKPEFAVSKPMGQRWLLDTYAGLWLFGVNNSYYLGTFGARASTPRGVPGTSQLHVRPPMVGGLRRDELRRWADNGQRNRTRRSADELAHRGHARARDRTTALGQARGEQERHHPPRPATSARSRSGGRRVGSRVPRCVLEVPFI